MRRLLCSAALAVLAILAFGASCALAAEGPRWKLSQIIEPSNLEPNTPRDAVQEVTVQAQGGTFALTWRGGAEKEAKTAETRALPYDATASEVDSALDELGFEGEITGFEGTVTGAGPGETSPYTVTFTGKDGGVPIAPLVVNDESLTGAGASANVKQVEAGKYEGDIELVATNVGAAATDGSTISLSGVLPNGVTANTIEGTDEYAFGGFEVGVACEPGPTISCTDSREVLPGDQLRIVVGVSVAANLAGTLTDEIAVSGGGAPAGTAVEPFTVSNTRAGFGIEPDSVFAALSSSQAGAHPNVTTAFDLNAPVPNVLSEEPKDVRFDMPPGLVGQTVGMPQCTIAAVTGEVDYEKVDGNEVTKGKACPSDAIVGIATSRFVAHSEGGPTRGNTAAPWVAPVYNIRPAPGEPAAFAFETLGYPVRIDTSVLSDGKDGVRVTAPDLTQAAKIFMSSITLWGVPAQFNAAGPDYTSPALYYQGWTFGGSGTSSGEAATPLLTSPQQCSQPLNALMETDTWTAPGTFVKSEPLPMGTLTGCEQLRFEPSFTMLPDTLEAGAPAGYSFNLKVPQQNQVGVLATPNVKNVKLTLPAGTVINPSAAWGLKACSDAQFYGPHRGSEEPAEPAQCPREAQVGTVAIKTPALEETLEGQVYLAEPECSPCTSQDAEDGKMVRLFVNVVGNGEAGIVIKLEGHGTINQQTGQITTVFEENPQLPFSELKLELNGGPRAVLANPRGCGEVSSSLEMASWDEALGESSLTSPFDVKENCFGAQFSPSFTAGMPNIQAGAHGEFTLAFGRSDDDQYLSGISTTMPPGLLGTLTGVELCKEAQANAGTCGANSLIGTTEVLTGPGADPFLVSGGQVFLTEGTPPAEGSNHGAPFGLSIVVPAIAGPYTLAGLNGNGEPGDGKVVVRAKITINPSTAALSVVSNPLPTMLDGIPLQLRAVNVRIDRPGFMFNPTSCDKTAIAGTLASAEGINANVSSPFQVTNCGSLKFEPKFAVSTSGKTSKADGASLTARLSYPNLAAGTDANIARVKVDLPKQLPSRLTTLQKACIAAQFEANPAGCPSASFIGHAVVHTPLLPVPLEGPAIFVSHGGEAFPSLTIVLQGYGVTVDLVGTTFISKTGVTSTTFKTLPDVPFNTFELTLPQGPYSALAANGDICTSKLAMPTAFIGQNGAEIHQSTPLAITGCNPTITVTSHNVKHGTATIQVSVPAAGRLLASGKGLSRASKHVSQAGTVTVELHLSKGEAAFLHKHRGRKLKVKVALTFLPGKGARLSTTTTVLIG